MKQRTRPTPDQVARFVRQRCGGLLPRCQVEPLRLTAYAAARIVVEQSGCTYAPIGTVLGVEYEQVTCPAAEGHHVVAANMPFGLSVYGYYNVGSYAFVGGSDVKIINPIL